MPYTYDYPRPAVTVDCVVLRYEEPELKVLLIRRKQDPYRGYWALPGGFINMDEELEQAARRELHEETGVKRVRFLEQFGAFAKIGRDPRGRTLSVVYLALLKPHEDQIQAADDAQEAKWVTWRKRLSLAFDHKDILRSADLHLHEWVHTRPLLFHLLPDRFTLQQLEQLYALLRGDNSDARPFLRRLQKAEVLEIVQPNPRLYRWNQKELLKRREAD